MCGIAGIVGLKNKPLPLSSRIKGMTASMRNRGREDEGYLFFKEGVCSTAIGDETNSETLSFLGERFRHIDTYAEESFNLAFGHRRLKIIDLSPSAFQPMNLLNRYWIIFNGEIYNYWEIREELKANHNIQFKTASDTEVLLASYIQWGSNCLEKLNGMFAFAVFDSVDRTLFLARDRMGIKPLFYTLQDNVLVFGSDIKSIIASGFYKPQIYMPGLMNNLTLSVSPGVRTSFRDVFWIDAGTYMFVDIDSGNIKQQQYWDVPIGNFQKIESEEEALAILDKALKDSVRYRMTADVEVGTFMSGGVDSTLISALAMKENPDVRAFTLGFQQPLHSEHIEATENALDLKINHDVHIVQEEKIVSSIDEIIRCYEEPYTTLSPTYFLSEYAFSKGVKVILNGLGADELFAGYSFYGKYNKINDLRRVGSLISALPPVSSKVKKLKRFLEFKDVASYYAFTQSNFKDYEIRKLLPDEKYNPVESFAGVFNKRDEDFSSPIEALGYYDLKWYIGKHQLYRADQFLMRNSMEGRFPFLDHNLIQVASRMPDSLKIKDGTGKYIVKKLAEKYLSNRSIYRPKQGFSTPVFQMMNNVLKGYSLEQINNLKKRGIFSSSEIDALMNKYQDNKPQIWQLVMTERWLSAFFD